MNHKVKFTMRPIFLTPPVNAVVLMEHSPERSATGLSKMVQAAYRHAHECRSIFEWAATYIWRLK